MGILTQSGQSSRTQFTILAMVCSETLEVEAELAEGEAWGQADFPEGWVPGHTGQVGRGGPGGGAHLTPGDVHEHG